MLNFLIWTFYLVSIAMGIWILVEAYRVHVGWAISLLVSIFFPIIAVPLFLVFAFKYWDRIAAPYIVGFVSGVIGFGLSVYFVPSAPSLNDAFDNLEKELSKPSQAQNK